MTEKTISQKYHTYLIGEFKRLKNPTTVTQSALYSVISDMIEIDSRSDKHLECIASNILKYQNL